MVRIEGLTKRFPVRRTWGELARAPFRTRSQLALDAVSFSVAPGEIFGVLGQNGAGKTTLFKLLSTLILADAGSAEIGGFDVRTDEREVRRLLAPVIANERSLYWRLSARENLRLYTALQGLHGAEARTEEERVLQVTGLTDTGAKMVGAFSSGMRQRLLIARALLGRPRVLLLDEPTSFLDLRQAGRLSRILTELMQCGLTILCASHDIPLVRRHATSVLFLKKGCPVEHGEPAAMLTRERLADAFAVPSDDWYHDSHV